MLGPQLNNDTPRNINTAEADSNTFKINPIATLEPSPVKVDEDKPESQEATKKFTVSEVVMQEPEPKKAAKTVKIDDAPPIVHDDDNYDDDADTIKDAVTSKDPEANVASNGT